MSQSGVEEFGRKVQRVQFELEQIRGTGVSGRIKVEVDAAGRLLSVRSPDGEAILEAYRQALAEAEAKAREVAQDVLNDPLATDATEDDARTGYNRTETSGSTPQPARPTKAATAGARKPRAGTTSSTELSTANE